MSVKRIYVQKREGFDIEAKGMLADLKENLLIKHRHKEFANLKILIPFVNFIIV